MRRKASLCVLLLAAACRSAPASEEVRADTAPRLPAIDSAYSHLDNTLVFLLPDSGGFIANGVPVAQGSIPSHLAALFVTRPPQSRAVAVWDNPRRRADAQWLARAAKMAGGAAFDAELSGWPSEAPSAP